METLGRKSGVNRRGQKGENEGVGEEVAEAEATEAAPRKRVATNFMADGGGGLGEGLGRGGK